jgi:hypothetical protein
MTKTLPRVAHEHHERLMHGVEAMPEVGALLVAAPVAELRPRLDGLKLFLNDLLIPHMEAAERAIYPELERMLQNRHSLAPLRREHDEVRRLVGELTRLIDELGETRPHVGQVVALRRII